MVTMKFANPYQQIKRWSSTLLALIVLCNFVWAFTSWNVGQVEAAGSTSFTREVDPFPDVAADQRITFGDYDDDGDIDALVQESNVIGQGFKFARADGNGAYTIIDQVGTSIPNSPFASSDLTGLNGTGGYFVPNMLSLDYDSDGDTDIISRSGNIAGGANFILRNDSGAMVRITDPFPDVQVDTRIKFADMDLDGDIDALVQEGTVVGQGYIYVQQNADGTNTQFAQSGTFIPGSPFASADLTGLSGTMFIAVDFDGDGDKDIINRSGTNFILRNDNGTFTRIADVFANTAAGLRITFGDFDSDGDLDALQQDGNTIGSGYFYMQRESNGSYTRYDQSGNSIPNSPFSSVDLTGLNGTNMHSLDYDSDGDVDIISRSNSTSPGQNFVLKAAGAPPVLPASAPAVQTGGVSLVSTTSAILGGTVNDNGAVTTVSFDYGPDTNYGTNVPATTGGKIIAGAGNTPVAVTLTGLTPNTTYHYRVKAVNSVGTTYGASQTFKTLALTNAAPPSIDTQPANKAVNVGEPANLNVGATIRDEGTLSYQWYSNSTNSNSGGTVIDSATTSTYLAPTTIEGTTYYYVVVTNTNTSVTGMTTATATSAVAEVIVNTLTNAAPPSIDTQPVNQTVNIGDTANLTASATVSDGGTLSYQWYSNSTNSNIGGTVIDSATTSTYNVPTTKEGTTYYYVVVTNTNTSATGVTTATATSNVAKVTVSATGTTTPPQPTNPNGPSTPSVPNVPGATNTGIDILVNGEVVNMGKATTSTRDDQSVITVTIDPKKLEDILASKGQHALVTIPVNTESDVVIGEFTGQMLKTLEDYLAVVEIKTDRATYTLPAGQINISAISDQFGNSVSLQDIKIQIEIAVPTPDMVKVVENAAEKGTFTLVVPPIVFTVRATYDGKMIEMPRFDAYVERTIAIPDGVDPNKITTGVVIASDGTVRHVPTKLIIIDGKHYAKVSSLTNSTYAIVWNPLEFSDVVRHWAKNAVNDMGSRKVINGTGNGMFSPDIDITRAEFAAIIVRGLGVKLEVGATPFSDVETSDWYNSAIHTALSYRLIDGYNDGTFRPNDKITREQAMVIMARAMTITNLKEKLPSNSEEQILSQFTDANNTSIWAKDSFEDCLQAGIVSGRNGTRLAPEAYITRAEVATLIQRLLQKSGLI